MQDLRESVVYIVVYIKENAFERSSEFHEVKSTLPIAEPLELKELKIIHSAANIAKVIKKNAHNATLGKHSVCTSNSFFVCRICLYCQTLTFLSDFCVLFIECLLNVAPIKNQASANKIICLQRLGVCDNNTIVQLVTLF